MSLTASRRSVQFLGMTTTCYNHPDREGDKMSPNTHWIGSLPYCPECHTANDARNRAAGNKRRADRSRSYSNAVRNYNR